MKLFRSIKIPKHVGIFLLLLDPHMGFAEPIQFDMHDASKWNVLQDADAEVTFGFEYSDFGITEAPGGGDTKGIRLATNIEEPGNAAGIIVTPTNFSAQGNYSIAVDIWMNFYADFGNVGTTEFAGVFLGMESVSDGVFDGTGLLVDTDGDTSRDYRLYNNGTEVSFDSGQYLISSQNNTADDLVDAFPGQETPEIQVDLDAFDPPNELLLTDDGTQAFAWHTWVIEVDSAQQTALFTIDGLEIGLLDEDDLTLEGPIGLAMTDIFTSVAPVPEFAFTIFDNLVVDVESVALPGDYNANGELDAEDIDTLAVAIREGDARNQFDLNQDGDVDDQDHTFWVSNLKNTWFGDANLDGEFNSNDFVSVFQIGEYEDATPNNSTWSDGDWNGDGEFSSSDFVIAFQDGGFEQGPKPIQTVPEPVLHPLALLLGIFFRIRKTFEGHKV